MAAHRFWRINVTSDASSLVGIAELSLASAVGGANLIQPRRSIIASASSSQGSNPPALAYDADPTSYWGSSTSGPLPAWWQADFGAPIAIVAVKIQNYTWTSPSYSPATWDLQSSPDATTWTTVQSYTSATWTSYAIQAFAVPASAAQRYWRVLIRTTGQGVIAGICDISMYDAAGGFASASSSQVSPPGNHPPSAATDGNTATYWGSNSGIPQWLSYEFGTPQDIIEVKLTDIAPNSGYAPTAFDLQYSDDNAAWITLQSFTAASWAGGLTQTFAVTPFSPLAGSVRLTGFAPNPAMTSAPGVGGVALTGQAPTPAIGQGVAPATGKIGLTGDAPSLAMDIFSTPSGGMLSLLGMVPTPVFGISVAPLGGVLNLSGRAPSADLGSGPSPGEIAFTGFAPNRATMGPMISMIH